MAQPAANIIWLIRTLTSFYGAVLLVRVVLSWLRLPPWHPISRTLGRFCEALTEPLLAPIRRWLEPYQRGSYFDFSPLVLYVLIMLARALLERLIIRMAFL